jgi:hypothetical protein
VGPWNFIEVSAVAADKRGNILVLHRGAHPIIEFSPDGKFVRAWGDGLCSEGKLGLIPPAFRTPMHFTNWMGSSSVGCRFLPNK